MDAGTEATAGPPDDPELGLTPFGSTTTVPQPRPRARPREHERARRPRARTRRRGLSSDARRELAWITVIYLAARATLIVAAVLLDAFGHRPLQSELANWDGYWYHAIALHGYPHQVSFHQTNLGFFPLFPITIALVSPILQLVFGAGPVWAATYAGVLISGVGGLVATIFVHRLAEGWWDRPTARRATVLFVVFPGAVVFSMVYSEGILLAFATVCIWALERRRWVLAGAMAGLGTAVQPVGLVLAVVCGLCALRELWRHGPRSREFAMSLLATVLSGVGVMAFFSFLWIWTGTPFATEIAQSRGWGSHTSLLAIVHMVGDVAPSFDPGHFNHPPVNLNYVVGTVGAALMLWELWLLWRSRRELSMPAIVWTLGITWFMSTTENTDQFLPPNPRLLITAFPMLILLARWCRPRRFPTLATVNAVLFVGLSLLTFYKYVLRP